MAYILAWETDYNSTASTDPISTWISSLFIHSHRRLSIQSAWYDATNCTSSGTSGIMPVGDLKWFHYASSLVTHQRQHGSHESHVKRDCCACMLSRFMNGQLGPLLDAQ